MSKAASCSVFKLIQNRKCQLIAIGVFLIIAASIIPTVIIFPKKRTENTLTTTFITATTTTTVLTEMIMTTEGETMNSTRMDKWNVNGITLIEGHDDENSSYPLYYITGFFIDNDDNQTVYLTDDSTKYIIKWKAGANSSQIVLGGNGFDWQCTYPPTLGDLIIDKNTNSIIFCDNTNDVIVRWSHQDITDREVLLSNIGCVGLEIDKEGYFYTADTRSQTIIRWKSKYDIETVVTEDFFHKNDIDLRSSPFLSMAIDSNGSIYISCLDAVFKWTGNSSESISVAGEEDAGDELTQLRGPAGIILDDSDNLYIADEFNHRVVCWDKGATEGRIVVGGNGDGKRADQLSNPADLAFDTYGNLYVLDFGNTRIQKFLLHPS